MHKLIYDNRMMNYVLTVILNICVRKVGAEIFSEFQSDKFTYQLGKHLNLLLREKPCSRR